MGRLKSAPPRLRALEPRLRPAPKIPDPFYQSKEWRSLVASIKRERGSRCQRHGCVSVERIIADHIVERKDGGADLERSNIELLCFTHHQQKTAAARRRRARGQA
ncbi:HNH endonuclease signature motif containing protein [Sphingobium boeckii]|uniref:5-methylcytosine-specific restriction endonuclease McrA n=1 Tax=Sphingobium boeckii TaxID=1082345 RepID=A0A7W9AF21_9SPHN|nr:HNH endonuclease signature motif containing protein [Sphingobium boeckii]MBB5684311.1 5-methylcytosine-specific restriction endonuclease McrA [Sphingobium boeckii]